MPLDEDPPCDSGGENIAASLIVVISSLAGILGNGLVIASYYYSSYLRENPGNCFTINLALADFLNSVYVQGPCMVNLAKPEWRFSGKFCIVHAIFVWSIFTASNWFLAVISVDRAIAMNRPFQYRNIVTKIRVRCIMAFIWIFSIALSSLLLSLKVSVSYESSELMCSPKWKVYPESFIAFILCYLLPCAMMLLCNCSIICIVKKINFVSPLRHPETGQPDISPNVKSNMKTRGSLYVLVIVYLFFVAPYYIAKFSFMKWEDGLFPKSLHVFYTLLMFLASALNPLIYAVFRKDHRRAMLKVLEIVREKWKRIKGTTNKKLNELSLCCRKKE